MDSMELKYKPGKLKRGHIVVKPSEIHGYGVFATKKIAKGEIIEECPILMFSAGFELPPLGNVLFTWKNDDTNALPLGYGVIYNHADVPNAVHYFDEKYDLLGFRALRTIRKNEEILISYSKNWFEQRGIKIKHPKKPSVLSRVLKLIAAVLILLGLSLLVFLLHR